MTLTGTNSYILGTGRVAVIDPGPADPGHLRAILGALGPGESVAAILVTHAHLDHSPLARPLARATGAPVHAFGDWLAGRSPVMQRLAQSGLAGGGEGVDHGFRPDLTLADGQVLDGDGWSVTAWHMPGHFGNHLCFAAGETIFTGDLVMGWASSLVSPPDGDLTDFMASCRRLATLPARRLLPGHGEPVEDPAGRIAWLIAHREAREAAILSRLDATPRPIGDITRAVYTDTPATLLPAAERNVFAHLVDLVCRNLAAADPEPGLDALFRRA
jgi:glyoxylase-like metal-dependent hydrolase (beta-lactamase superfamily II)